MTQEEQCLELMMWDVIRIDFVKASGWALPVPFNVPSQSVMSAGNWQSGALTLSVGLTFDRDAMMQTTPTNKVTESREAAGIIHTHTLNIPIDKGFQTIRDREAALQAEDHYVVLYTVKGTRFLLYTLPNTWTLSVEEQQGQSGTMTIKAVLKSMSGAINIH